MQSLFTNSLKKKFCFAISWKLPSPIIIFIFFATQAMNCDKTFNRNIKCAFRYELELSARPNNEQPVYRDNLVYIFMS